ncbi:MAG: hypothetical protein WC648_04035 [Candidatus Paceibacterota bacterium]|jgi:DNA polymerase III delta subunit
MLYVFHGENVSESSKKARTLIDSLRKKRPEALFVKIDDRDWDKSLLESHLGGQGLFSSKYIVFLDKVTLNEDADGSLSQFIEPMHESSNIFIVFESKLRAEYVKLFAKYAEKVVVSEVNNSVKFAKNKEFNIFGLGDAIGTREVYKAWMLYREALDHGLQPENIIGTVFWQVKSIILASKSKSAAESGLSPFVFNNCKRFASNYSMNELSDMSRNLVSLYHDGHRGLVDLELAMEKFILKMGTKLVASH